MIVLFTVPDKHQSFGYVFCEKVKLTGCGENGPASVSSPMFWFVVVPAC